MLCTCPGLHGKWQTRTVVASTGKQTPGWAPSQLCCSPESESKHKHFLRSILLQHEELKFEDSRISFFCNFNSSPLRTCILMHFYQYILLFPHITVVEAHPFYPSALLGHSLSQLWQEPLCSSRGTLWTRAHSSSESGVTAPSQLHSFPGSSAGCWGHVFSIILGFRGYPKPHS